MEDLTRVATGILTTGSHVPDLPGDTRHLRGFSTSQNVGSSVVTAWLIRSDLSSAVTGSSPMSRVHIEWVETGGEGVAHPDITVEALALTRDYIVSGYRSVQVLTGRVTNARILGLVERVLHRDGWRTFMPIGGVALDLSSLKDASQGEEFLQLVEEGLETDVPFAAFNPELLS